MTDINPPTQSDIGIPITDENPEYSKLLNEVVTLRWKCGDQADALKIARDALENAPIIGLTESAVDFRKRQDLWAYGQWKAAIKALKESK
jgi:hypothetical protein